MEAWCQHDAEYDTQLGQFVCERCCLVLGVEYVWKFESKPRYLAGNKPYEVVKYVWKVYTPMMGQIEIPEHIQTYLETLEFSGDWYLLFREYQKRKYGKFFLAAPAIYGHPFHYEDWMLPFFLAVNDVRTRANNLHILYVTAQGMELRGQDSQWIPIKLTPPTILKLDIEWWDICKKLKLEYQPLRKQGTIIPSPAKSFGPRVVCEKNQWGFGYPSEPCPT